MFIEIAHKYWKEFLKPGDWVIDATAGNGHDTLFLAQTLFNPLENNNLSQGSGLIAIDIQEDAIKTSKNRLKQSLPPQTLDNIFFYQQSHQTFPTLALEHPISLIVYNLGYLPGSDKKVKTLSPTTLSSLENAVKLLNINGMISIMCYPGHPEGAEEEAHILDWCKNLSPKDFQICYHSQTNKPKSPTLIILHRK